MKNLLILSALAAIATPAAAHVTVTPVHADKDAYVVATFRVGHGCDGAATTEIRIQIPDGLQAVRPRAVPGWRLTTVGEGAAMSEVVWTGGPLPEQQFEQFDLLLHVPDAGGMLYFPVTQICGNARTEWGQIPPPGASGDGLTYPAPAIHIGPMGDMAGHDMSMHMAPAATAPAASPAPADEHQHH